NTPKNILKEQKWAGFAVAPKLQWLKINKEKIEPFIPEITPPRIEFSVRDSDLPLVDCIEILQLLHKIVENNREEGTPTILAQADRRLGNVSKSDTVRKYI
ncbi:unnamed protein product, partial [Allacma fusca]